MTDRRFSPDEATTIFGLAAYSASRAADEVGAPPASEGLTLAELQAIGREVGIAPSAIAHAVVTLEVRRAAKRRTWLGLPIGVARTVALDRRVTEAEWEQLVVELREVFHARGVTRRDGSLRQWTNGNLQVLLEPTAVGDRIRLATVHGAARGYISGGVAMVGISTALAISAAVSGVAAESLPGVALLSLVGLGMIGNGALRLPSWARRREQQMEHVAVRLASAEAERDEASGSDRSDAV